MPDATAITIDRLALKLSAGGLHGGDRIARRVGDRLAAGIHRAATAAEASELHLRVVAGGGESEYELADLVVEAILNALRATA
jgi:hypothetical protein